RRLNIIPSALSSDNEFLRRVYLDTVGLLPTIEESKAFLESKDPDKRAKLIDQLVDRPEFADVWATRFADLFRTGLLDQGYKGGRLMYNWVRKSIAQDKPYNQFATELLTASGQLKFNPTANFYYVTEFSEPENIATDISQVFLGVRLECARCHNHPWEKWTQDDFWGFAAFFGRMGIKDTYENDESQVLLKIKGEVIHPKTKKPIGPKYLDGPSKGEAPHGGAACRLYYRGHRRSREIPGVHAGHPRYGDPAGRAVILPRDFWAHEGARGDLRARHAARHGASHAPDQRRNADAPDHGQ